MTAREFGDQEIEPAYHDLMVHLAKNLDTFFNKGVKGKDREIGFVLLVFPFGEKEGRCNYISNGADRRDVLKLLREQAKRFEQSLKARP